MKIKIINAKILTMESEGILENATIEIVGNKIDYVGKNRKGFKYDKLIDAQNNLIMPGLINTHTHSSMTLFRGIGATDLNRWWIDNIRPLEEELRKGDCYNGSMLAFAEMMRNGITLAIDMYMFFEEALEAVKDSGIRAGISFGSKVGIEEISIEQLEYDYKNILSYGERVFPLICAHSTYSTSEEVFGELIRFAKKHNLIFTTHVSETLKEVGECDTKNGCSPVGLLEKYGFFDGTKTLLAHCVHCDKDDMEILRKYDVSVSSNPSSNLYLGSGIAPLFAFKNKNINVSLGTDGAASNNSLDLFKEIFLAKNLQSGLLNNASLMTNFDCLKMATINGAKALGFSNLGLIKKGYLADLIIVNLKDLNMQPNFNILSNLVNSATGRNVILTMINGNIVYDNGKFNFDIEKIKKNVEKSSKELYAIKGLLKNI